MTSVQEHRLRSDRTKVIARVEKEAVKPMTQGEQETERTTKQLIKKLTIAILNIDLAQFSFWSDRARTAHVSPL
jgi:hypothetical protein